MPGHRFCKAQVTGLPDGLASTNELNLHYRKVNNFINTNHNDIAAISDSFVLTSLVESQARCAISGYRGNLSTALEAEARGWIPQVDDPGVAGHLDAIRSYLAATGVAEGDEFLLRYALVVPGMQCGIVPPLIVLEPNRNGLSERRKRERRDKSPACVRRSISGERSCRV